MAKIKRTHLLGIRINNVPVSDKCAKIIVLAMHGLSLAEISNIIWVDTAILSNILSEHYFLHDTQSCLHSLAYYGLVNGFTFNFHFRQVDVLSPTERELVADKYPALYARRLMQLNLPACIL